MTLRAFRRLTAVAWFAIVVSVFALIGEPLWLGVVVGLLLSGAYAGMTARARAAGWLGPAGNDGQKVKLVPVALAALGVLLAAALVYLALALALG